MLLSLLASLALTAPQANDPMEALDELRLISGYVALGQACASIQKTTIKTDVLGPYTEALIARARSEGKSQQAISDAQELGASTVLAQLNADYPEGRAAENAEKLGKECDSLNREVPRFFAAYTPAS